MWARCGIALLPLVAGRDIHAGLENASDAVAPRKRRLVRRHDHLQDDSSRSAASRPAGEAKPHANVAQYGLEHNQTANSRLAVTDARHHWYSSHEVLLQRAKLQFSVLERAPTPASVVIQVAIGVCVMAAMWKMGVCSCVGHRETAAQAARRRTTLANMSDDAYDKNRKSKNRSQRKKTTIYQARPIGISDNYVDTSYQEQQMAVLVTDMSGFTSLINRHGVVHFASIILRTRQICLPILHRFGVAHIGFEGEHIIAILPSAGKAVAAAHRMRKAVEAANNSLEPDKNSFRLTLENIGLHYGVGPVVDRIYGKVHGNTLNCAQYISHQVASKHATLVTEDVVTEFQSSSDLAGARFMPLTLDAEEKEAKEVGILGRRKLFELKVDEDDDDVVPSNTDDGKYISKELLQFTQRHAPTVRGAALETVDSNIRSKYQKRKVVMAFNFSMENVDIEGMLEAELDCQLWMQTVFARHGGVMMEDTLYFFDDPASAVLAASECRRLLTDVNKEKAAQDLAYMAINGYGVDIGDVLIVPGTGVHWGEPVNIANKLGLDWAADDEILISKDVHDEVVTNPQLHGLRFEAEDVTISKMDLQAFKVVGEAAAAAG